MSRPFFVICGSLILIACGCGSSQMRTQGADATDGADADGGAPAQQTFVATLNGTPTTFFLPLDLSFAVIPTQVSLAETPGLRSFGLTFWMAMGVTPGVANCDRTASVALQLSYQEVPLGIFETRTSAEDCMGEITAVPTAAGGRLAGTFSGTLSVVTAQSETQGPIIVTDGKFDVVVPPRSTP